MYFLDVPNRRPLGTIMQFHVNYLVRFADGRFSSSCRVETVKTSLRVIRITEYEKNILFSNAITSVQLFTNITSLHTIMKMRCENLRISQN